MELFNVCANKLSLFCLMRQNRHRLNNAKISASVIGNEKLKSSVSTKKKNLSVELYVQ